MKFRDLSEEVSIIDEGPVGLGSRLKTKAQKFVPGKTGRRAQTRDVVEKAANQLSKAFDRWVGQTGVDPNNVKASELRDFFYHVGYGKSADKVLGSYLDREKEEEERAEQQKKIHIPPQWRTEESVKEAAGDRIVFDEKTVDQLIVQVVQQAARSNPQGLLDKVKDQKSSDSKLVKPYKSKDEENIQDLLGGISDADYEEIKKEIEELGQDIAQAHRDALRSVEMNKILRNKIEHSFEKQMQNVLDRWI